MKSSDSYTKHSKKISWHSIVIGMLLGFAICLAAYFYFFNYQGNTTTVRPMSVVDRDSSDASMSITSEMVEEQLVNISEFATIEYLYTTAGEFEQAEELGNFTIPFSSKHFIASYDGSIKAGIDMSKIEVEISKDSVIITLPEAEILSHEVFEETLEVYDESKNIFNQLEVTDFATFTLVQKENMEKRVVDNGILEDAKLRSADLIEMFISAFVPEGVSVIIT